MEPSNSPRNQLLSKADLITITAVGIAIVIITAILIILLF